MKDKGSNYGEGLYVRGRTTTKNFNNGNMSRGRVRKKKRSQSRGKSSGKKCLYYWKKGQFVKDCHENSGRKEQV